MHEITEEQFEEMKATRRFENLYIAQVRQVYGPDEIWTSDKLKPERGILFGLLEGQQYIRADGTMEPFDWSDEMHPQKGRDHAWRLLGLVQRDEKGVIVPASVAALFA